MSSKDRGGYALLMLSVLSIVGVLIFRANKSQAAPMPVPKPKALQVAAPPADDGLREIVVDVSGAVATPGVYHLRPKARVDDAVRAAGGFAKQANRDVVNLAARLEDGQKIVVPRIGSSSKVPVM